MTCFILAQLAGCGKQSKKEWTSKREKNQI